MTTITPDAHHASIETVATVAGKLQIVIRTLAVDGVPARQTTLRDQLIGKAIDRGEDPSAGLRGITCTETLRVLAAKLTEHAEAVELYASSYHPASFATPAAPRVEVAPGFPLTMTTAADTVLGWLPGVEARDREADLWRYTTQGWRSTSTSGVTVDDSPEKITDYLPASIIPTSWPVAARDTTTEN